MTITVELAVIGALGSATMVVLALLGTARQRRKDREEQQAATSAQIHDVRKEIQSHEIAAAESRGREIEWRRGVDEQLSRRREQHDELIRENARQHTEILDKAVEHIEAARSKGSEEHRQLRAEMREDLSKIQASFDRMSDGLIEALSQRLQGGGP